MTLPLKVLAGCSRATYSARQNSTPGSTRCQQCVHQARFSGPETGGQGSRKMPGSQPGHRGHGGLVWLSLGNDDVFSDRWTDGLRRRMRGGPSRNRAAESRLPYGLSTLSFSELPILWEEQLQIAS